MNENEECAVAAHTTFADRLLVLLGDSSVSAFARQVRLSESLIRKYLKGSEPSLSRAHQIAMMTGARLDWLASGQGEPFYGSEEVDLDVLAIAGSITERELTSNSLALTKVQGISLVMSVYRLLTIDRERYGAHNETSAAVYCREELNKLLSVEL